MQVRRSRDDEAQEAAASPTPIVSERGDEEDEEVLTERAASGWGADELEDMDEEDAQQSAPAGSSEHVSLRPCSSAVQPRSSGPVAGIRVCTACGTTSDKVCWEASSTVRRNGKTVEVPDGDFCLPCAVASDAFPKMDRDAFTAKLKTADFRASFAAIRDKAIQIPEHAFPPGHVFGQSQMGVRIETERGPRLAIVSMAGTASQDHWSVWSD